MDEVDVVVVGASFAGLTCAKVAASRGLRTRVLERKSDPGACPHTTGVLVRDLAEEWQVPRQWTRTIGGVRLYAPSLRWIDLERPGYYFLATDTPAVLRWLAGQAEAAGAQLTCGVEFKGASPDGNGLRVDAPDLRTRFLVGADGPHSGVARLAGLGTNRHFLMGAEIHYAGVRGVEEDRLHCFLEARLAPGYIGWVVPGVELTQVGLAGLLPLRPRLDLFVRRLAGLFDFSRARAVGHRTGLIPVGGPVRPFASDRVVLVGDAAGLTSPVTGAGIYTAWLSGWRAAHAVWAHLRHEGPEPQAALRGFHPRSMGKRLLRFGLDLRIPDRVPEALLGNRLLRALAPVIFFHHCALWSRTAWHDMIRAVSGPAPSSPSRREIARTSLDSHGDRAESRS